MMNDVSQPWKLFILTWSKFILSQSRFRQKKTINYKVRNCDTNYAPTIYIIITSYKFQYEHGFFSSYCGIW